MNIKTFKKRFNFSNDILNILLDGNTSSMSIFDKDGILCNITFDENGLPIVAEQGYIKDNQLNGSIIRHGNDSEKIQNKIYNWLKRIFNI